MDYRRYCGDFLRESFSVDRGMRYQRKLLYVRMCRNSNVIRPGHLLRKKLHDTVHLQTHAILWDTGTLIYFHTFMASATQALALAINSPACIAANAFQAPLCLCS